MSTIETFDQILNRLEHLDREKRNDLQQLKKIVIASTKEEMEASLDELDLKKVFQVFKKLLKSDEKFICEEISDIFNQIEQTLGSEQYYTRFSDLIGNALTSDSTKLKSIHLKILHTCLKSVQVQKSLTDSELLSLVIDNLGDQNEEVGKRSFEIIKYLSLKNDSFIDDHLFSSTHSHHLKQVTTRNEVIKFRYYEFLIDLILEKESLLLNQHIQQGVKELLELTFRSSDDPLVIRNCLIIIDKLIEDNKGIEYLEQFRYFQFIAKNIIEPSNNSLIELYMPGFIETFSKIGSNLPDVMFDNQNAIKQLIDFILEDNFASCSIQAIGLIGRLAKGKEVLNSNEKFLTHCLPRLGQFLDSSSEYKIEVLNCLACLFDLNDSDATVQISDLLNNWYSRLMNDRKKMTQIIFVLCKQVFPEMHLNSLNLIRILCKHHWGQNEFAQLNTFLEYALNRNTESDYKGKAAKFKLITELALSPFTSKAFGPLNHAKIRKVYEQGAFYIEQDVSVAVKEQD